MSALDMQCATGLIFSLRQHFSHVWKTCCKKSLQPFRVCTQKLWPFFAPFSIVGTKIASYAFSVNWIKFLPIFANLQSTVIVTSSDTGLPTPLSAVQVYLRIQYSTVQYSTGTFSGHCEISRSPYDSSKSVCLGLVLTCRRERRWHCGERGSCCYHCTEEWDSAEIVMVNY